MSHVRTLDDMWDVTVKARGVAAAGRPFAASLAGSCRVGLGSLALVFRRLGPLPNSAANSPGLGYTASNGAYVTAPSIELQVRPSYIDLPMMMATYETMSSHRSHRSMHWYMPCANTLNCKHYANTM